jgi:hypothetical protein
MRPSVICGYLLLAYATWVAMRWLHALVIARRSRAWRLVVSVIGLSLGWAPATQGRIVGHVLVALGGAASASLAHEIWWKTEDVRLRCRRKPRQFALAPAGDASLPASVDGPLTELDQAALHMELLRSHMHYLERARQANNVHAQHDFAAEVATTASRLHDALDVVVSERVRVRGTK